MSFSQLQTFLLLQLQTLFQRHHLGLKNKTEPLMESMTAKITITTQIRLLQIHHHHQNNVLQLQEYKEQSLLQRYFTFFTTREREREEVELIVGSVVFVCDSVSFSLRLSVCLSLVSCHLEEIFIPFLSNSCCYFFCFYLGLYCFISKASIH